MTASVKSWSGSAVRILLLTVWFVVRRLFWPQPMERPTQQLRAGSAPQTQWFGQGLVGLYGEARPGRPRTHDEEKIAQLLRTVLQSKPADGTH
nr:hypothetical protein [Gluconobacter wancherniae]